jgi:probable F420-dependent oxidoreductase
MRVMTSLPQHDLRLIADATARIEARGYDGVTVPENRNDPFLPLAVAAVNSTRIELATGIAIAFARSPMVVANTSWDLQRASGGRFVLGLGSQVKGHNERRFSVPWSAPAPRVREYVQALRAIWRCWQSGEKLDFEGEHYRFTLMTPNFTPPPLETAPPPVTIAAVGPVMMRVAGEVCDGARLHAFCTRKYVENVVMPRLERGMAVAGRARENFQITGGGFVATGPDDAAVARVFEWVRTRVGFYGSTRAYWPVLEQHGLEDLGEKLNHMSKTGKWDAMAAEIDDDVVHLFCAVGRHDQIAKAIEERFGGGVSDAVSDSAPGAGDGAMPPDLIQDLKRIPTPFRGFAVDPPR